MFSLHRIPPPADAHHMPRTASRAERRHPLVSACLITKDEADNLPTCFASLRGVVDEIVVYDTGSGDGTPDVARRLGATAVLDGYWDDDFSRARNAALAHCRGDWILWIDADETLECDDPRTLRSLLVRTKAEIDAWSTPIDNLTGAGVGAGFVHHAARIFRRSRCEWTGRLHEQVTTRRTHGNIRQAELEVARIRHTGYLDAVMQARDKIERNLRMAEREVEDATSWDRGYSLTSLGRSYLTAGKPEEAAAHCSRALEHSTNDITRRLAMRTTAEALVMLGRFDEAGEWVARLRQESTTPVQADVVEVRLALASGDHERALELLDGLGVEAVDEDGFEYTAGMLTPFRAEALTGLDRFGDAADVLLAMLGDQGILDVHLGNVVVLLRKAGRPLSELADCIPADQEPKFMAQILQMNHDLADVTLDALYEVRPEAKAVLAAAATVARRIPIARSLVWSDRLRRAGYAEACPLIAIAKGRRPAVERAQAAATAHRAFADDRAAPALEAVLRKVSPLERPVIMSDVRTLSPALADQFDALLASGAMAAERPVLDIIPIGLDSQVGTR